MREWGGEKDIERKNKKEPKTEQKTLMEKGYVKQIVKSWDRDVKLETREWVQLIFQKKSGKQSFAGNKTFR